MGRVDEILQSKLAEVQVNYRNCAYRAGFTLADFTGILAKAQTDQLAKSETGALAGGAAATGALKIPSANLNAAAASGEETPYEDIIDRAAAKYDLSPALLKGVIRAESNFHTTSVSHAGAMGLMQLMPGTAKSLGVKDAFDPEQNIFGGAAYLRRQLNRFGDVRLALAAYNTGPHRVGSLNITDPDKPAEYAKLSERVRGYVEKVLHYAEDYA
jgi:soluble lytic murein transglycosylase-like protein